MLKKLFLCLILVVFTVLIYSFSRQIYDSLKSGSRLDESADKLSRLQKQNSDLKKRLVEVESLQYIESQARDKLNQTRFNETLMIIAQKEIDQVLGLDKKASELKIPNWQGWLKLFWK